MILVASTALVASTLPFGHETSIVKAVTMIRPARRIGIALTIFSTAFALSPVRITVVDGTRLAASTRFRSTHAAIVSRCGAALATKVLVDSTNRAGGCMLLLASGQTLDASMLLLLSYLLPACLEGL